MSLDFGQRIKQLRKEFTLTQEDLAKILSKTRSAVAGYESEGKQPDFDTLNALADYFDVSTDYLLGRTDIKKIGPRRIYSASELVEILPDEYKELFLDQNLGYIEFAKGLMKDQIDPADLIELIRVAQNVRKEHNEKNNIEEK